MNSILKIISKSKMLTVLIILIMSCILVLIAIFLIDSYVKLTSQSRIISIQEATLLDADCILVLGAGVWEGGRPSFMLEDRLLTGVELYKNGASDRLLMSGDNGRKDYDEVNVMKGFAVNSGINSEHIFMDHAGFSTYESMYRARDIFDVKKTIIVTQEYHLYRAIYIADRLGIEAYGVASNPRPYVGQKVRDFREVLARFKDFFKVIMKPKPTYLGESIPVTGNGDITND